MKTKYKINKTLPPIGDPRTDILMFIDCKSCGETAKLHHQHWCSCTCQNCSATIHNPLHDCEGSPECYFEVVE